MTGEHSKPQIEQPDTPPEVKQRIELSPETSYQEVEEFLAEHADMYEAIDGLWVEVKATRQQVQDEADSADATDARSTAAGFSRDAHDYLDGIDSALADAAAQSTFEGGGLHAYIDDLLGFDPEEYTGESLKNQLKIAYFRATVAQSIGIKKVELFLADDSRVLPFTDRLTEMVVMARHGHPEFPGLLETIATNNELARIESKPNILLTALERSIRYTNPVNGFVEQLLTEEIRPSASYPDGFVAGVAAVRALAEIITVDEASGITQEDIMRRVSEHFNELPAAWRTAYQDTIRVHTDNAWGKLLALLKPFERSGRLPSNYHPPAKVSPQPSSTKRRNKQRKPSKLPADTDLSQAQLRDIDNLSSERGEVQPIEQFCFLRSIGGSDKLLALAGVGDLDEIMISNTVTKFLRGRPDMVEDLKKCLAEIARNPLPSRNKAIKPLEGSDLMFSLAGEVRKRKLFRFSAAEQTRESGTRHELARRIRIVFSTVVDNDERYLAIKQIDLRDAQTYR